MIGNVCRLFFDAEERVSGRIALAFPEGGVDREITFGELRKRTEVFAGGLASEGFGPGKRAIVMVPMSIDLYVVVLGVLTAGGTVLFIDPWIGVRKIASIAAGASPDVFVGVPKAHLLRLLQPSLRRIPVTISTPSRWSRIVARSDLRAFRGVVPLVDADPEATALVTYTTGSSGTPKGVVRTHATLAAQHDAIREEFPAPDGDVDMTTFPIFGLSNLASGITTVVPPIRLDSVATADADAVLDAVERFGVTTITSSPPLFDRLAESVLKTGASCPLLRRIVTGGAPVEDAQLRRWSLAFPATAIEVAYGSSEAEPVAKSSAAERLAVSGSAGYLTGRPVSRIVAKVIPISPGPVKKIEPLGPEQIGELVVNGPHVCRRYEASEEAFRENKVAHGDEVWHRMGDTGWFDDVGRFWLAGRVHSTIWRDGRPLHAQLLEQKARRLFPDVRRTAAVGTPPDSLSQRLILVLEGSAPENALEILHASSLPVDEVVITEKPLPVDPRHNSKIDYTRIRELLERGGLR